MRGTSSAHRRATADTAFRNPIVVVMHMQNFLRLCRTFRTVMAPRNPDWQTLASWPLKAEAIERRLEPARDAPPPAYRTAFVTPLRHDVRGMVRAIDRTYDQDVADGRAKGTARFHGRLRTETLMGAVVDWTEPKRLQGLTRFAAVVSDIYRAGGLTGAGDGEGALPPMVTFASPPGSGASTMNRQLVQETCGAAIGVVSLPPNLHDRPLTWGALAHEVAGHDVIHTVEGLLPDLQAALPAMGVPADWRPVWHDWLEEAAADVLAVLNVGPTSAVSLAAYLAAARSDDPVPPGPLGTLGFILYSRLGRPADEHPIDLLRVHLAIGVVETLDAAVRDAWLPLLRQIAERAARKPSFAADPPHHELRDIPVVSNGARSRPNIPLQEATEVARKVGAGLVRTKVAALDGASLADKICWDADDEACARRIRDAALRGDPIRGMGDCGHLLAGATMALLEGGDEGRLTQALNEALSAAYAADPVYEGYMPA
ncbi:MAG: hypothetical protein BGO51_07775 [Rhodospirillales bacterium 69-11]|nr:MAG: hypothetical protein BGO51_07775 [Rhodospirillales bacterium 69-11]